MLRGWDVCQVFRHSHSLGGKVRVFHGRCQKKRQTHNWHGWHDCRTYGGGESPAHPCVMARSKKQGHSKCTPVAGNSPLLYSQRALGQQLCCQCLVILRFQARAPQAICRLLSVRRRFSVLTCQCRQPICSGRQPTPFEGELCNPTFFLGATLRFLASEGHGQLGMQECRVHERVEAPRPGVCLET